MVSNRMHTLCFTFFLLCFHQIQSYNNSIKAENLKPGTSNWKLTNPVTAGTYNSATGLYGDIDRVAFRTPVLEGYAWPPTGQAGDTIDFYISTQSSYVSIQIYRMGYYSGLGGRDMLQSWTLPGTFQNGFQRIYSGNSYYDGRNWESSISFTIPNNGDWTSGIYVAKLTTGLDKGSKQSYIPFVVRNDTSASQYVMQFSWTTWHAYNGWGSSANYNYITAYNNRYLATGYPNSNNYFTSPSGSGPLSSVEVPYSSLLRPFLPSACSNCNLGNGAGQLFAHDKGPNCESSYPPGGDTGSQSQGTSCAGWEYNTVRFLEANGYDVTYITNFETDVNQIALASHAAFLSVGHDEYWSMNSYLNVKAARDNGMALIFLSGNQVWNAIDIIRSSGVMTGDLWVPSNFNPNNAIIGTPLGLTNPSTTDFALIGGSWEYVGNSQGQITLNKNVAPAWFSAGVSGTNIGTDLAGYETNGVGDAQLTGTQIATYSYQLPAGLVIPLTFSGVGGYSTLYNSSKSLAFVFAANTISWAYALDPYNIDTNYVRQSTYYSNTIQITENLLQQAVVIPTPKTYKLICICFSSNGVLTFGGTGQTPVLQSGGTDSWVVNIYTGSRAAPGIPYHGQNGLASDTWYTIDNANGNGRLMVGNNGNVNGPVWVYGNSQGQWGQTASNPQQYWRLIPYTKPTGWTLAGARYSIYLIQSASNNQLLINGCSCSSSCVSVIGDETGWGEPEGNQQKMWAFVEV